jgi:hypothetical protein
MSDPVGTRDVRSNRSQSKLHKRATLIISEAHDDDAKDEVMERGIIASHSSAALSYVRTFLMLG